MPFWLKKLLKPRWVTSYYCVECEDHYCGGCGRGVAECSYFYTKAAAMAAAIEWVSSAIGDSDDGPYTLITEDVRPDCTVVNMNYKDELDLALFATVEVRRYY